METLQHVLFSPSENSQELMLKNNIELAHDFIELLRPLVYEGRFALSFSGAPRRRIDEFARLRFVELAKRFQLHKKLRHSQAGISILFSESAPAHWVENEILNIRVNHVDADVEKKRITIILVLFLIVVFLVKYKNT